jgi:hypothetical protein
VNSEDAAAFYARLLRGDAPRIPIDCYRGAHVNAGHSLSRQSRTARNGSKPGALWICALISTTAAP